MRAVYTAETAGKLSDPVPRREFQGSSVKISEALKEVMKKKKKKRFLNLPYHLAAWCHTWE